MIRALDRVISIAPILKAAHEPPSLQPSMGTRDPNKGHASSVRVAEERNPLKQAHIRECVCVCVRACMHACVRAFVFGLKWV